MVPAAHQHSHWHCGVRFVQCSIPRAQQPGPYRAAQFWKRITDDRIADHSTARWRARPSGWCATTTATWWSTRCPASSRRPRPWRPGRRVAVILPASEALATDSDAPAKGAAKLAQVIPYALEERVADEIENLHFAIGERDAATGRVPVRGDRARAHRRAARRAARRRAQSPGYLLRSHAAAGDAGPDDRAARRRHADAAHRRRAAAGVARAVDHRCLRDGAADADLARSRDSNPRRSACCCTPATTNGRRTSSTVDALRDRFTGVKVQLLPSGSLSVLAPAAASGDAVNLLQGALAVASPLELGWRSWRVAAVLAASLLCLHLGARYFELNRAAQERSDARRQHPGCVPRRHARPAERHQRAPARRSSASPKFAVAAAAARCCRRCRPSPMRAARRRPPRSKASLSATARSTCASSRPMPRVSTPSASSCAPASWQADIMGGSASGDSYRGRLQVRKAGA